MGPQAGPRRQPRQPEQRCHMLRRNWRSAATAPRQRALPTMPTASDEGPAKFRLPWPLLGAPSVSPK